MVFCMGTRHWGLHVVQLQVTCYRTLLTPSALIQSKACCVITHCIVYNIRGPCACSANVTKHRRQHPLCKHYAWKRQARSEAHRS